MLNQTDLAAQRIEPTCSTLLALVQSLTDAMGSPEDVVDTAMVLVNSGRVILTGNFKGCRLSY
jgi:hypothetical protein